MIASTTSPVLASAIALKLCRPNAASKPCFAAVEFLADVFWLRIVPISESSTLETLPHVRAELLLMSSEGPARSVYEDAISG